MTVISSASMLLLASCSSLGLGSAPSNPAEGISDVGVQILTGVEVCEETLKTAADVVSSPSTPLTVAEAILISMEGLQPTCDLVAQSGQVYVAYKDPVQGAIGGDIGDGLILIGAASTDAKTRWAEAEKQIAALRALFGGS